jgi:hypothetical protein
MDDTKTQLEQAKLLYAHGKLAESEEAFGRLIDSGYDTAEVFYYTGLIRGRFGDRRGAVNYLKDALERDPQHADALYQLGYVAEHSGNLQEAKSYYGKAQSAKPGHARAQQRLEQLLGSGAHPATSNIGNLSGRQEQNYKREAPRQAAADAHGRAGRHLYGQPPGGEAESQPMISQLLRRVSGPATSTNSPVVGVVRNFRARTEPLGWSIGTQYGRLEIWTFSVEGTDEAGNPLPPITVQMKGSRFDGVIFEGDEVEVQAGRRQTGELVNAKEVYNRTKNATVRVRGLPGLGVLRIAVVLVLLFIATIFFTIGRSACYELYYGLPGPVQSLCRILM